MLIDRQVGTIRTDICHFSPTISALGASCEVLAVMDACGTDAAIDAHITPRMEHAGVWLTSINTLVAEHVQGWSSPQGTPLVRAMTAISPKLAAEWATP